MSASMTIIAYHALEAGPGPVCLTQAAFERQIRALVEAGSTFLTMDAVVEHRRTGEPFPDRAVALTFDDAYASVHRVALPFLDALGIAATVFPVTSQLGGWNRWDSIRGSMPEMALVTRSQLDELVSAGWEVGGHTHTHRPLPGLSASELDAELATSVAILEDQLGRPVPTFAYPYGHHDAASRQRAGATHAACLAIGAHRARLTDPASRIGRVDAWYLQRAWQVSSLASPVGDAYLLARRAARGVRRRVLRR